MDSLELSYGINDLKHGLDNQLNINSPLWQSVCIRITYKYPSTVRTMSQNLTVTVSTIILRCSLSAEFGSTFFLHNRMISFYKYRQKAKWSTLNAPTKRKQNEERQKAQMSKLESNWVITHPEQQNQKN